MAGNVGKRNQTVAGRALALLGAFDIGHPRLSLTELARRADLPLATTHRLAAELTSWRALDRDADGHYRIGLRLWETGLLSPISTRLRAIALPFMQDLYEATRENIHLAIRDGYDALYVDKLSGHRSVPIISRAGSRLPMHSTGVGKALLANAEPTFIQAYCQRPLPRFTRYTITEPRRLQRELRTTARRGYALTAEEMTLGSCSIAVPIPTDNAAPTIALGIVVHTARAELPKQFPALRDAATAMAQRLRDTTHDPAPGFVHDLPPLRHGT